MTQTSIPYTGPTAAELDRLPAVLKTRQQWVLWRGIDKVDKRTGEIKLNKVPYNAQTLKKAMSTNAKTWSTFADVVAALPKALAAWEEESPADYRGGGIGFVFSPQDPFCGIDLDKCRNPVTGELAPWAAAIIAKVDSYTEASPSDTGAHIIAEGTLPPGDRKNGSVEMYEEGRYFTITGQHLSMTPTAINARQEAIDAVHAAHVARPVPPKPSPRTSMPLDLDDMTILVKAKAAQNGAKFADLWAGDTSRYGGDDSAADLAFCCELAFWTRDPGQLDRLFRGSGLMRDKWDAKRGKQTYGERTIAHALSTVGTSYDPEAWRAAQMAAKHNRNGQPQGSAGLSSLSSLNSQSEPEKASPATTPDEPLSSLSSLSSQSLWPTMSEDAFYGLAGKVVDKISPHSESDRVALLMQLLTYVGVIVGRKPYFPVEATKHYPNLDVTLMGETSKARKGTSYDVIEWIMRTVDSTWSHRNVISGCGSGEGLINAVRDPVFKHEPVKTKGKITDYTDVMVEPGVSDKRLLVYESEFASVLKVSLREGNILSMTLRQAWESGNLHNTVKTNPQHATNAHIALIGHITIDELRKLLTSTEAANGFGNRFLWLCVKRSKLLPDGGDLFSVDMQEIVDALREVCAAARSITKMTRDKDATVIWHAIYKQLSDSKRGLPGALAARGEAQVLRLGMIYALLEQSSVIRPSHLYAALAVWEYVEASIAYVFDSATGHRDADTLLEALQGAAEGRMTKTEIISEVFHGHIRAHDLNQAIRILADAGIVTRLGGPTTGGRRKEYICYGHHDTNISITRTRMRYRDIGKSVLDGSLQCACDCKTCEKSEKSEESRDASMNTCDARKSEDCELSEKSEERLGEDSLREYADDAEYRNTGGAGLGVQVDGDCSHIENEEDDTSTLPKSKGRTIASSAPRSSYCAGCGRNTTWLVRGDTEVCYKCKTTRPHTPGAE